MASLQLPNYVMLEIIDWLPYYYFAVSHVRKITLIEALRRKIDKVTKKTSENLEKSKKYRALCQFYLL